MPETPPQNDEDQITKKKTIYDVGVFEIFWRNFLAGFARSLGGYILYIIFIFVLGNVVVTVLWPKIQPLVDEFQSFSGVTRQIQQIESTRSY